MKILMVTDLYPIKESETTTAKTIYGFVSKWIESGVEVDVVKPNFILNSFLRNKPFYKTGGYKYRETKVLNLNYFTPFLGNILNKISKEYDFSSYDMVIAHMPSGIIFAQKITEKFDKPLVCSVHVSDLQVLTNPLYSIYFKSQMFKAYKKAIKIACRSPILQKNFCELYPEFSDKTFLALSGVDKSNIYTREPNLDKDKIKVLTCANLIKRKNIDKLILAINGSKKYDLEIIGDGCELKKLEKMAAKNIKFHLRLNHSEVLEKMRAADIFILPSERETFGMVYLEAMASGCITVCKSEDAIDGIIIDSENGFLCESSPEKICECLDRIHENKNIKNVIGNAYSTVEKLSPEFCAQKYFER